MQFSRLLPTLAILLLAITQLAAQGNRKPIKIVDSGQLYSTPALSSDEKAQISRQVGSSLAKDVYAYINEDSWPSGIATLESRNANRPKINNYVVYEIARFDEKVVLVVPADENKHMPSTMRPTRDIYFLIGETGVESKGSQASANGKRKRMYISDSNQLYSTPEFSASEKSIITKQVGASLAPDVFKYITEETWPVGISTLDNREEIRPQINDYVVYEIARYDTYVVLVLPASENKHMPSRMRPTRDIYFLIGDSGLSDTPPSQSGGNVAKPGQRIPARITDSNQLYSTPGFSASEKSIITKQVGAGLAPDVFKYITEENWPVAISTLDNREEVRPQINKYKVYEIARYDHYVVLVIPSDENGHMPSRMRPTRDIYFLIDETGVESDGSGAGISGGSGKIDDDNDDTPPPTVDDDGGDDFQRVHVTDPGELMSTYDLKGNDNARELILQYTTEEVFNEIARLANEDAWPSGISTFAARDRGTREKIPQYVMYFVARFEDSPTRDAVLVYIPYEENQGMPSNMRPTDETGFYMVFTSKGVEIEGE